MERRLRRTLASYHEYPPAIEPGEFSFNPEQKGQRKNPADASPLDFRLSPLPWLSVGKLFPEGVSSMEVREKYIARVLANPANNGFTEIKFVHTAQILTAKSTRLRCQYTCRHTRQSDFTPPFSLSTEDARQMLDEYKYGLMMRTELAHPFDQPFEQVWRDFEGALLKIEQIAFIRGYGKAFVLAAGNCLFGHHDDSVRPCEFPGKSRPTLEAIGIDLHETFSVIAWNHHLVREESDPFQLFGLLVLE